MTTFLKKSKNPIFGPFCLKFGKNEFSWKKVLSVFKYSNYLPSCQKFEKTNEQFLRKIAISKKNAERTDGQTENVDFIGLSVGRGPIKRVLREELRTCNICCFLDDL